jgi:putative flippase GtrA
MGPFSVVELNTIGNVMSRFVSVGMAATLTYFLVVMMLTAATTLHPETIVAFAYLTALPVSYLGHRRYTFDSNNRVALEFLRFLLAHGAVLLLTQIALYLAQAQLLATEALYHIVAAGFIFIFSFIIMKFFVFQEDVDPEGSSARRQ